MFALRSILSDGLISPRSSWRRESNSVSGSVNAPKHPNILRLSISDDPLDEKFFSYLSTIAPCGQVTELEVPAVSPLMNLRSCVSCISRLDSLNIFDNTTETVVDDDDENNDNNDEYWVLRQGLADPVTCRMLQGVQLRKLIFSIPSLTEEAMPTIRLIIERLPQLQSLDIECDRRRELPQLLHALINGLAHLTSMKVHCGGDAAQWTQVHLRLLQTAHTRAFWSEVYPFWDDSTLFVSLW